MRYAAQTALSDPARSRAQIWRLIAGLVLVAFVYGLLLTGWFTAEMALGLPPMGGGGLGVTPWSALNLLATFVCVYPGLWLALRWLHRRPLSGLFGPRRSVFRDGGRVMLAAVLVYAASLALPGPEGAGPVPNLPPARWLIWLIPGLVALIVQVTAEELLFRGYVQSQLAARFRSPVIWLGLPALAFGVLHYSQLTGGANAVWLLLPPTAFGLLAADLTARCGNLGPAIGLHLLNNFAAILVVAPGLTMSGLALFRLPIQMSDPVILEQLPIEIALLFVIWLAARIALRR